MPSVLACLALGALLLVSAGAKLADRDGSRGALATYGLHGTAADRVWAALVAVEVGLAVGVAVGEDAAAWAAAGLFAVFAVAHAVVLAAGRGGAPCACFGARGQVGAASLARAAVLSVAFAGLPLLPRAPMSAGTWYAIGLAATLLGVLALSVVVLALAREVGELRAAVAPQGALEVPEEGPELGGRSALVQRFGAEMVPGRLALAVFTSEGCRLCRSLAPALAGFARDPRVVVRTFDEVADADVWSLADTPGSPYAVALDADGTVLAKGTYNTPGQLESVLAAAERRRGRSHV